jgi:hypothetical protein
MWMAIFSVKSYFVGVHSVLRGPSINGAAMSFEAMLINVGTWSVPEAGQIIYGLSRRSSYQAAKRGDFPVVRVGRLDRVPIAAVAAMFVEIGKATAAAISARSRAHVDQGVDDHNQT